MTFPWSRQWKGNIDRLGAKDLLDLLTSCLRFRFWLVSTGMIRLGLALIVILAGGIPLGCSQAPTDTDLAGTTRTDSLISGGLQRSFTVYFPRSHGSSSNRPVLIAFHGAGGTGQGMRHFLGNDAADRYGYVAVYPEAAPGTQGTWALGCFECTWADMQGIDDYQFGRDLIATLASRYAVSTDQVYITGLSLGGSFVYDWGCRDSQLLRGILVIVSLPSPEELPGCRTGRPIEVMIMNGDADPNIPWNGGGRFNFLSADSAARLWRQWDGCDPSPVVSNLPDLTNDGLHVVVTTYQGCRNGVRVRLYRIEGGGHAWPAGDLDPIEEMGKTFF